jgi:REP element-mobilizing transposase RayT
MSQSLVRNPIHIVFSTKHRQQIIREPVAFDLYSYVAGICKHLECLPIQVGGHLNHIHILCELSRKIALMNLVEKVKANSSHWMKTKDPSNSNFYWQSGYGAFGVALEKVEVVRRYIENQAVHHQQMSFEEEYRAAIKEQNFDIDERYLWD